jgi:hypothetical protein
VVTCFFCCCCCCGGVLLLEGLPKLLRRPRAGQSAKDPPQFLLIVGGHAFPQRLAEEDFGLPLLLLLLLPFVAGDSDRGSHCWWRWIHYCASGGSRAILIICRCCCCCCRVRFIVVVVLQKHVERQGTVDFVLIVQGNVQNLPAATATVKKIVPLR